MTECQWNGKLFQAPLYQLIKIKVKQSEKSFQDAGPFNILENAKRNLHLAWDASHLEMLTMDKEFIFKTPTAEKKIHSSSQALSIYQHL